MEASLGGGTCPPVKSPVRKLGAAWDFVVSEWQGLYLVTPPAVHPSEDRKLVMSLAACRHTYIRTPYPFPRAHCFPWLITPSLIGYQLRNLLPICQWLGSLGSKPDHAAWPCREHGEREVGCVNEC